MKKILSVVLAIALIVCAVPLGAFTFTASAATSGYYTYTISNNEATITYVDKSISGDITIPSTLGGKTVTAIGEYAFGTCDNLTKITIPNTVKTIGDFAFESCISLVSANIPNGVTRIGYGTFLSCVSFKNLIIPDSVTSIGAWAFEDCVSLRSVNIPDSVTEMEKCAFAGCSSISNLTIGNGIKSIDESVFKGCDSLTSVIIPEGVIRIGESAFEGCDNIKNIMIPDSVISIGKYAFYDCSNLTWIIMGDGVTSIFRSAFYGCYNLKNVYYAGSASGNVTIVVDEGNEYLIYAKWHYNRLFPDATTTAWYSDAVKYVVSAGIMSGYSNGKFGTSDSIQRQDFLVMLARLDEVDLTAYGAKKSAFSDVPEGSYFEAAVNWGAEKGIVTGYDNGKFGVGDKVTREQLVTFLYRYADYKGYDSDYSSNRENIVSRQYDDYKKVSGFAKDPILWAIEKGVISGKTSSTIAPQGNAQRCEVAKIMYNIYLNDIFK